MIINGKLFDDNKTYVMGIINVTPDSFSDGGSYLSVDDVLSRVDEMITDGAAIIDIGGESTRPGHIKISDDEEISRIAPVIEAVAERFDIIISADTYKASVARAAIKAGAHIINDIWGLQYDEALADVIRDENASVVVTHNRENNEYNDFMTECVNEMRLICDNALNRGIDKSKIIIDPGIGFAKDTHQNLSVMKNLKEFDKIGYPVLLGASRKSFIGNTLSLPVDERLEGTLAVTALAVMNNVRFVRVHDVKENVRVIKMLEAIASV